MSHPQEGDRRTEVVSEQRGLLLVGDTQPVLESARSLTVTPATVLPGAAFCKVAFAVVSSVTPVLSPEDLSHS